MDKLADYFDMNVQATRLNWYRDTNEWKPFHHDAAAVKPDKARTQNMTVAVSFGAERDAAFEHAKTKTVISMPQVWSQNQLTLASKKSCQKTNKTHLFFYFSQTQAVRWKETFWKTQDVEDFLSWYKKSKIKSE